MCVCILILFPYALLQNIEYSSLCYTIGPWLYVNPVLLISPSPHLYLFFFRFHISNIICYLSFSVWLTSLSMIISTSIGKFFTGGMGRGAVLWSNCKTFSSIPSFYPLDTNTVPTKHLQTFQNIPWGGGKCPQLRNTGLVKQSFLEGKSRPTLEWLFWQHFYNIALSH